MLTDRKLRIVWKAYLCELGVMQALERPSEAEVAERVRQYLCDSSRLAEVLIEILEIATGKAEIVGWWPGCSARGWKG